MAKAILVINKPDNCCECPFMSGVPGDHYCQMGDDGNCNCSVTGGQRPDWCPLVILPEQRDLKEDADDIGEQLISLGFNECLDALEGKTDE